MSPDITNIADPTLYPSDRTPPKKPAVEEKSVVEARAMALIETLVPDGGKPLTYQEIVHRVRYRKSDGCYTLMPEEIVPLIEAVKAKRATAKSDSQLPYEGADKVTPIDGELGEVDGRGVEPK